MARDGWVDTWDKHNWSTYYFDHNGHYEVNAWHNENGNWTYFKSDGQQANEEWVKALDGKWYYFDDNGTMAHDVWLGTNCKNG
jgi:glucan-binding YG repeat protein